MENREQGLGALFKSSLYAVSFIFFCSLNYSEIACPCKLNKSQVLVHSSLTEINLVQDKPDIIVLGQKEEFNL